MSSNCYDYRELNGIYQFAAERPRTLLIPGWHQFPEVSPFIGDAGLHCRRAAVFVGEPLHLPDTLCLADEDITQHETRAASIVDGDVYTAGCRSAHGIHELVAEVLQTYLGIEDSRRADWALCQGAAFHSDAVFDELFALFHVSGTPGELHLPRLGCKVYMSPGSWVIFDCAEPHGFTNDGEEQFSAESNLLRGMSRFLNVGIGFDDASLVKKAFGYRLTRIAGALRTDDFEVDEVSGRLRRVRRKVGRGGLQEN